MKDFWDSLNIKDFWDDIWWKYHHPHNIRFGGRINIKRTFRWQRMFNILLVVIIVILLFKLF
jgi:hypothetical protein